MKTKTFGGLQWHNMCHVLWKCSHWFRIY